MSAERQRARQSAPHWTHHARRQWTDSARNDVPDRARDRAWREAVPVDYPSAYDGATARYHRDGDAILIVKYDVVDGQRRPVIITVINLRDRSLQEQAYVRAQALWGADTDRVGGDGDGG